MSAKLKTVETTITPDGRLANAEELRLNKPTKAVITFLVESNIQKSDEVCGGDACVGNTRIPVWALVELRDQGLSEEHILDSYPQLTEEMLKEAFEYASENVEEVALALQD